MRFQAGCAIVPRDSLFKGFQSPRHCSSRTLLHRFGSLGFMALLCPLLVLPGRCEDFLPPDALLNDWVERSFSPAEARLIAVTYGQGIFVAGGENGILLSSQDGISWQNKDNPAKTRVYELTYGNGRFVGVGFTLSNQVGGVTSTNGTDWITWSLPFEGWFVCGTYGNGVFVAGAGSATDAFRIVSSTDGLNWVARQTNEYAIRGIAFGGDQFVFISSGLGGIWRSTDGTQWNFQTNRTDSLKAIAYGNGRFVVVGQNGTTISTNGLDWHFSPSSVFHSDQGFDFVRVRFFNGLFFAVDAYGGLFTSEDGTSWISRLPRNAWIGAIAAGRGTVVAILGGKIFQSPFLLPRPRFQTEELFQADPGGLALNISSLPDVDVDLEISENLIDWMHSSKIPNPTGNLKILEPIRAEVSRRFYRLKVQPP